MRGGPVTLAGTAHGLAVDGYRPATGFRLGRVQPVGGPGGGDRLHRLPVDPARHPPNGGLARWVDLSGQRVRDRAQGQQQRPVGTSGPLRRDVPDGDGCHVASFGGDDLRGPVAQLTAGRARHADLTVASGDAGESFRVTSGRHGADQQPAAGGATADEPVQ